MLNSIRPCIGTCRASGDFKSYIAAWHELKIEPRKGIQMIYDAFYKGMVPLKLFRLVTQSWEKAIGERDVNVWRLNNCFSEHTKTLEPGPAFRTSSQARQVLPYPL